VRLLFDIICRHVGGQAKLVTLEPRIAGGQSVGLGDTAPPSQLLTIRSGDGGVTDTLRLMAQLARQFKTDPLVRQTGMRIVQPCPGKDDLCEVSAIQNWVRSNIRYTSDVLDVETLHTPLYTLQERAGDCDDQATLTAALLMTVGIPAAYCAVGVNGGSYSHVMAFAGVRNQGRWVSVETTLDRDPFTGEPIGPGWFPPDATCQRFWHI